MVLNLQPPLVPRNGCLVKVLGIARISTVHQDALSLADQEALYRTWLHQNCQLPIDLHMIAGRGSGECLDRQEILQATIEVETGTYDLVIAEDMGRIFRRVHAQLFCELCEDFQTRVIALNDQVDTAQDNWRLLAGFASMRHEMYNADTSKRIRRTLRNRFQEGGVVQTVLFGYVKVPDSKNDSDLKKDPAAEPIYQEMFHKLEEGASFSEIADWFNESNIKPGPAARSQSWRCSMVSRLIHNPILKGVRVRNKMMSKRVNQTGHRKSVKAPASERLERHCPHLAFIEPARYDRLIAMLDERNSKFKRKGTNGIDPRKNVPKKKTVWPGQHIDCGICGRLFVYGGHGQTDHLMCQGARDYRCWNGITVDGPLAAEKMIVAIFETIKALPDFDCTLVRLIEEEYEQQRGTRSGQYQELTRRQCSVDRSIQNILAAIREAGHSTSMMAEMARLDKEKIQIAWELQRLEHAPNPHFTVPKMADIKEMAMQAIGKLSVTSSEFGRLLRKLIPRITVFPFRLIDDGKAVQRARFNIDLASLLPTGPGLTRLREKLTRSLVVDLFDPPQREAFRSSVMVLTANGLKQRDIALELRITQTAVQRAVALSRRMEELGIKDPYVPLTAPPEDGRHCRHKHPRFRFEALDSQESEQPPIE